MSATNRGSKRLKDSAYVTPTYTTKVLLKQLKNMKRYTFFEPCIGTGAISNLIKAKSKQWAEITSGRDYFKRPYRADVIITNPPFSLAAEFLEKSLAEAKFVAYLLRVNFFGAQKRYPFWKRIGEPTHLFPLSVRPSFIKGRTDATEYAWFVWDDINLCKAEPGICVIK